MMNGVRSLLHTIGLLGLTLALAQPASAVTNDLTYVGVWNSVASGNPVGMGGPGLVVGQKYVLRISYDDLSTTIDNVAVLTSGFADSGNDMRTIQLDDAGNSLDIFVPMEGLDSGSPFIYQQNETDHFAGFIPSPTLNFINLSNISLTSNIIGLEYEGDFVPGGVFNVIEMFNTSPGPAGADINMVSQILNCGDINCLTSAPAANDTNLDNVNNGSRFALAVALVVDAGTVVYNAGALTQTTASIITQSNDLGAARSDGEDFIDAVWVPTGTPTGNDIMVDIINSGLTMTTSMTTWDVTMTEQMTFLSSMDSAMVSYLNAAPTGNAVAISTVTGTDFTLMYGDDDLAVNGLIAGFEMLFVTALVDGAIDGTAFFTGLISTGTQSNTNAMLETAFGLGLHTVVFTVTDKAGASVTSSADFEVREEPTQNEAPVIASISNQSMQEGGTLNIPLSATDPDSGDSLAFSANGMPGFCSLTDNGNRTGSIACNPSVGDSGTFSIIVTVTDDGSPPLSDSDIFVLTVNSPPSLSNIGNQAVEQETTQNILLSATDPDPGDSLAFSASGLPSFCSLTDNGNRSGSIACNPVGGDSGTFNVTVTVTDDGSPALSDSETFDLAVISQMSIDIKLGSDPNSINLKSKGNIPVAILTNDTFYALEADPLSIEFGPGQATESHGRGHVKDVDGDGDMDLVLHFNTQDTGIRCGDTMATLTGETFSGQAITGSDAVRIVKCR